MNGNDAVGSKLDVNYFEIITYFNKDITDGDPKINQVMAFAA